MRRALLAVAILVVLTGCVPGDLAPATTTIPFDPAVASPGPYVDGAEVFIVYPDAAPTTGIDFDAFRTSWEQTGDALDFPTLVQSADGPWVSELFGTRLRVALDVVEQDGEVLLAQMSVENRATTEEDFVYVDELIPGFLGALGVPEAQALLVLDDVETLFDEERTAEVEVDGLTVSVALNRWALVLGVSG